MVDEGGEMNLEEEMKKRRNYEGKWEYWVKRGIWCEKQEKWRRIEWWLKELVMAVLERESGGRWKNVGLKKKKWGQENGHRGKKPRQRPIVAHHGPWGPPRSIHCLCWTKKFCGHGFRAPVVVPNILFLKIFFQFFWCLFLFLFFFVFLFQSLILTLFFFLIKLHKQQNKGKWKRKK